VLFQAQVMVHLGAAYNLARWLTRSGDDAEDLVQEAYLRAWKGFAGFRGPDGKAWLLTIVRNACYTWLKARKSGPAENSFDEEIHREESGETPETLLLRKRERLALSRAVEELPIEFREVLVLREWEGLSYKEISAVANIPIGTVMSRLVRARERLQKSLARWPEGRI
jgi:RNA polymerase sigma factor (sigma-70 family)